MVYYCSRKCKNYKGKGGYFKGNKKCTICKIFIKFNGYFCPCCGYRLKSKPRGSKGRKRLSQKIAEQKTKF